MGAAFHAKRHCTSLGDPYQLRNCGQNINTRIVVADEAPGSLTWRMTGMFSGEGNIFPHPSSTLIVGDGRPAIRASTVFSSTASRLASTTRTLRFKLTP